MNSFTWRRRRRPRKRSEYIIWLWNKTRDALIGWFFHRTWAKRVLIFRSWNQYWLLWNYGEKQQHFSAVFSACKQYQSQNGCKIAHQCRTLILNSVSLPSIYVFLVSHYIFNIYFHSHITMNSKTRNSVYWQMPPTKRPINQYVQYLNKWRRKNTHFSAGEVDKIQFIFFCCCYLITRASVRAFAHKEK